jgi:hypothetical protein
VYYRVSKGTTLHGQTSAIGRNLGQVFNFRSGRVHAVHLLCYGVKLPKLKLKTQPKQLFGYLLLDIALPEHSNEVTSN